VCSRREYNTILGFLLKNWTIPVEWSSSKRQSFLEKMKQYVVLDNGKSGDYPNGPQIYVRSKTSSDVVGTAKLYVPEWHKEQIMKKFHGAGTPGAHFGRTRIHELVCVSTLFLTDLQSDWKWSRWSNRKGCHCPFKRLSKL
jgi:hypothetical protein